MTIADLTTLAGLAAAVTLVMEVVKRLWSPTADQLHRFGPAVAIFLGVVIGGAAAGLSGADVAQAIITGAEAGGLSIGIYAIAARTPLPTYTPSGSGSDGGGG